MKLKYEKFDRALYNRALGQWQSEVDELGQFPSTATQKLNAVLGALNGEQNQEAYAVTDDEGGTVFAACEVIVSKTNAVYVKQIEVVYSPQLDEKIIQSPTKEDVDFYVAVYKQAVKGHINFTAEEHNAKHVNFYARNDQEVQYLKRVASLLQENNEDGKLLKSCRMDGRWLKLELHIHNEGEQK